MRFPNALEGVKKIYKAEIIALVAAVVGVVASIIALAGLSSGTTGGAVGAAGAGVLLIAVAVLLIIAFIMNIVGLNKAKPDEENFKYALYCVFVGIIASIVLGAAKEGSFLKELGDTASKICSFLTTYYVCTALISLAEKLENREMAEGGQKARKLLMTVWVISIVISVLGIIFNAIGGTAIAVVAVVLALVASVIEIIAYILYLKLLSKSRAMLEA